MEHELFVYNENLAGSIQEVLRRVHGEVSTAGGFTVNDVLVTVTDEMTDEEVIEHVTGRTDYTVIKAPEDAVAFLEEWLDILARQFTFPRYAVREACAGRVMIFFDHEFTVHEAEIDGDRDLIRVSVEHDQETERALQAMAAVRTPENDFWALLEELEISDAIQDAVEAVGGDVIGNFSHWSGDSSNGCHFSDWYYYMATLEVDAAMHGPLWKGTVEDLELFCELFQERLNEKGLPGIRVKAITDSYNGAGTDGYQWSDLMNDAWTDVESDPRLKYCWDV